MEIVEEEKTSDVPASNEVVKPNNLMKIITSLQEMTRDKNFLKLDLTLLKKKRKNAGYEIKQDERSFVTNIRISDEFEKRPGTFKWLTGQTMTLSFEKEHSFTSLPSFYNFIIT